jgi:hypothetical protein
VQLDQDVADRVHPTATGAQPRQRLGDEAVRAAPIGAVRVERVWPVRAAQRRLVGTVDAAAVSKEAVADGLAIEEGVQVGLTNGVHADQYSSKMERVPKSPATSRAGPT